MNILACAPKIATPHLPWLWGVSLHLVKTITTIILLLTSFIGWSQIDTTLDFKERFYSNDKLLTQNQYTDSFKTGKWIEYFDKKWRPCDRSRHSFFRLTEYLNGKPAGKTYDFYKNGKLQMIAQYTSFNPDYRTKTAVWFDEQGNKTKLEHIEEDFWFEQGYYKNGIISYYRKYLRDVSYLSYKNSAYFNKDGTVDFINYWNHTLDSSYSETHYRNGNLKYLYVNSNQTNIREEYSRTGEIKTKISYSDSIGFKKIESFKNKILQSTEYIALNSQAKKSNRRTDSNYPVVKYYQTLIGCPRMGTSFFSEDSVQVVGFFSGEGVSNIDSIMSIPQYQEFKTKNDSIHEITMKKHYWKEYSTDSVIIWEALRTKGDLNIGYYKEYDSDGNLYLEGSYDKKGRRTSVWWYFDENGIHIYSELYEKGDLQ